MLRELTVKDIALIEKAHIEFGEGFNVLTGETGAGKSVLIDSCMLALGAKLKSHILRSGAESAYVELVFSVEAPGTAEALEELDICPDESGTVTITRRIYKGRSVTKVNDETVTLSRLREAASYLIDIYGQNEYHTLLDRMKHLEILDSYIHEEALLAEVSEAFLISSKAGERCASFDLDEREKNREEEILSYELHEIEEAKLRIGEEEELEKSCRILTHMMTIARSLRAAAVHIEGTSLDKACGEMEKAIRYDESLSGIRDEIIDAQSLLQSALHEISDYTDDMETDGEALRTAERRLDLIRDLERKYGRDIEEVLSYKDRAAIRLEELADYEEDRERAAEEYVKAQEKLAALCSKLSALRKEGAGKLCAAVTSELSELGFTGAAVSMEFEEAEPSETGSDLVMFTASLNPGEPFKPLSEIASGGELSRIMLAVKTVLARTDDMPTLIFDEIDAGISGRAAQKTAEKLVKIANNHQVICVSHLPQIAAMADTHFVIEKAEQGGRNVTRIEKLTREGSIEELARLLSGADITGITYAGAGEMKEQADELKSSMRL